MYQLRDELNDLGEAVSTERLSTIILDALPAKKYSTIKVQAIQDPDLSLEDIEGMIKAIFINHSETSSVPTRSHESYRKGCDSGCEPTMSGQESAMATVITCHNCKNPGHRMKYFKQLTKARTSQALWRIVKNNSAHVIEVMVIPTRMIVISSSRRRQSQ